MQVSKEFANIQACYDSIHSEVEMAKELLNNFYQKASADLKQLAEEIDQHVINIKFFVNMEFPRIKKNLKEAKIKWYAKKEISEYNTLVDKLISNLKNFQAAKPSNLNLTLVVPSNLPFNAFTHLNDVQPSNTPCSKVSTPSKASKKSDEAYEGNATQILESEVELEDWQVFNEFDDWCVIKTDQ